MARRVLLFTGKGGVGKTTCAAATALRCAALGYRTLVISSDPAHSLGDAFDLPLGPEPVPVRDNLHAQEVDLYCSMKKYWANIRELLLLVFKWQGISDLAAEEMAAIPGMGEASALLWIDLFYQSEDYDLIIVDSAPTGETLTFLTLPQVTEWWLLKAIPFQKLAVQTLGLAVRKTTGIPLDRGYLELKQLFEKLRFIHGVLSNPEIASIRLVMNPEKMVVQEARRAYTYLQLYGYGVDAAIVNRVLPEDPEIRCGWEVYLSAQQRYLEDIEQSFSPLPIFKVPHFRREVFGLPWLERLADALYGEADPAQVFFREKPYQLERDGSGYLFRIRLPLLSEKRYQVHQYGDQLVIQIENQRRNYFLPHFLNYYRLEGVELEGEWLRIRFVPAGAGASNTTGKISR